VAGRAILLQPEDGALSDVELEDAEGVPEVTARTGPELEHDTRNKLMLRTAAIRGTLIGPRPNCTTPYCPICVSPRRRSPKSGSHSERRCWVPDRIRSAASPPGRADHRIFSESALSWRGIGSARWNLVGSAAQVLNAQGCTG
jgi:hypothetical protein